MTTTGLDWLFTSDGATARSAHAAITAAMTASLRVFIGYPLLPERENEEDLSPPAEFSGNRPASFR
jgi:hypothetical protein